VVATYVRLETSCQKKVLFLAAVLGAATAAQSEQQLAAQSEQQERHN
jgi:hypothetical protein